MKADVAQRRGAQQSVHDGVYQDVRIRMAQKTFFIRDFHPAEDQPPPLDQFMDIVSGSYAHTKSPQKLYRRINDGRGGCR